MHAFGQVRARVYYFAEAAVQEREQTLQPSGRSVPYRAAYIGGWKLFESAVPYEEYRLLDIRAGMFSGAALPLRVVEGVCEELVLSPRTLTQAERREQAAYEAEQGAFLRVPADAEIVEKTVTYTEEEGCTIAVVCVVTEESIGMERELPHGGDE